MTNVFARLIGKLQIPAAVTLVATLASVNVLAAAGDADPTFGGAGYVRYAANKTVPGLFAAVLALEDGSVIAAGGADTHVFVRHYRADGTSDTAFGNNGTTLLVGFNANGNDVHSPPGLHLARDAAGRILIESRGTVRRLSATGAYDPTYAPATLNVIGQSGGYTFLPQADGRFVVVTGQQTGFGTQTSQISVRFFLPDGKPDTVRGDQNGERLVYPGGQGIYTRVPTSAVNDAAGRILIAARWDRTADDTSLVLIRLNPDGSYDPAFGQNGVVLIGSQLGNAIGPPLITLANDGRIAYAFDVGTTSCPVPSDSYFVVNILTSTGGLDASSASGGRVAIVQSAIAGTSLSRLQWSSPFEIDVVGIATALSSTCDAQTRTLESWHIDITKGISTSAELSTGSPSPSDGIVDAPVIVGRSMWVALAEQAYRYGRIGASPLTGYGRGVLARLDLSGATGVAPTRIVAQFSVPQQERFDQLKPLSDGKLLVLGTYQPDREQLPAPTLTRFTADGRLDPTFGDGNGRHLFQPSGVGDGGTSVFVPSNDDPATVLRTVISGFIDCSYAATLWHFVDGTPDATFGTGGKATVLVSDCGSTIANGYVDDQGGVNLIRLATNTGAISPTVTVLRYNASGGVDSAFRGAAQAVPVSVGPAMRLDRLPDGRSQAILVGGGNRQITIQALRWLQDGSPDPSSPLPAFVIDTADPNTVVGTGSLDALVLPDGRTLVALMQASQRIVLRLRADGSPDATFGTGGTARIDGAGLTFYVKPAARLATDADGRILLAYQTPLGAGAALTVARFTADGQRDPTFTVDGRFDSLFSLNAAESASDIRVLPDGHIVVVGQSGTLPTAPGANVLAASHGLVLRLRGTSTQPSFTTLPAVEFHNFALDHYFTTASSAEIVSIDKGGAGDGWERTGNAFRAFIADSGAPGGASPVCRFYGTPGRGPNSHFYTASAAECSSVRGDPGWTYEGIAFYVVPPINDLCPGSAAVYRAYNNGFTRNDSNHRYSTQLSVLQAMTAQGWSVEGVAFCGAPD